MPTHFVCWSEIVDGVMWQFRNNSQHTCYAFEFQWKKKRTQAEHGPNCIAFLCGSISFSCRLFISKPFQTISNNICVFAMQSDKIASTLTTMMAAFFLVKYFLFSVYRVVSFQDVSYCYSKCQKCYNIMLDEPGKFERNWISIYLHPPWNSMWKLKHEGAHATVEHMQLTLILVKLLCINSWHAANILVFECVQRAYNRFKRIVLPEIQVKLWKNCICPVEVAPISKTPYNIILQIQCRICFWKQYQLLTER